MTSIRSCIAVLLASYMSACGSTQGTSSNLKSFTTLVLTANNTDPSLRIGYDAEGRKIASFGDAVGSEFIVSTWRNPAVWTPLSYPRRLAGEEVISVISLEFNTSQMPVFEDEYPDYQSTDPFFMGCGDDFEFKGKYHPASFQVRAKYTSNGTAFVKTTPPIVVWHGGLPTYPADEKPGTVSLTGIHVTGSDVKDLVVEIGEIVPRVAMGYCRHSEDQGSWESKSYSQGTVVNFRIKKISIPYAVNKTASGT